MSTAEQRISGGIGTKYFLIFLKPIPGKLAPPDVVNRHADHLAELDRAGKLVLAGPVPERGEGIIVLHIVDADEARAIADEDPFVRGGYQSYEIATWLMSNRENAYHPNLAPELHQ
jgi:uncharacterized protein YciI